MKHKVDSLSAHLNILRILKCSIILFLLMGQMSFAQHKYFFPVKPNQRNYLSGNMGELRTTHFHAGIDVKTDRREGLDIYATEDGYVSRIKVSSYGYGNVLYVTHPDGNTSVYAHLRNFRDDIAQYVLEQQYQQETFEIELFPEQWRFPVQRAEFIAHSGNSGSSMGPHLHFEIRETATQRPRNGLLYNFDVRDNIHPSIRGITIYPVDNESRVNGKQRKQIYTKNKKFTEKHN